MKTVTCVNAHGESVEAAIDSLETRLAVYGVILKGDEILLTGQWDGYDFPGGAVEQGETLEEAFAREVKEETGILAKKGDMIYMHEQFYVHPVTKKCYHSLLFYYIGHYVSGDLSDYVMGEHEHDYNKPPAWVPLDKVNSNLKMYNPIDSVALIGLAKALSLSHSL